MHSPTWTALGNSTRHQISQEDTEHSIHICRQSTLKDPACKRFRSEHNQQTSCGWEQTFETFFIQEINHRNVKNYDHVRATQYIWKTNFQNCKLIFSNGLIAVNSNIKIGFPWSRKLRYSGFWNNSEPMELESQSNLKTQAYSLSVCDSFTYRFWMMTCVGNWLK